MSIYPAFMAIDLLRKKANRRDLFCCFTAADDEYELPKFQKNVVILEKQPYQGLKSTICVEDGEFEDEGLVVGRLHSLLR